MRTSILAALALTLASLPIARPAFSAEHPGDPEDFETLEAVCGTRCHDVGMVTDDGARPFTDWMAVFEKMSKIGVEGSDEDFDHVVRYIQRNLTLVNVNTANAEDLKPVLGVSDAAAKAIVARRQRQKFSDLTDLSKVSGLDLKVLEEQKDRIQF